MGSIFSPSAPSLPTPPPLPEPPTPDDPEVEARREEVRLWPAPFGVIHLESKIDH